nr:uncharacterized protein LOC107372981 [Nothobranchius furzeri]
MGLRSRLSFRKKVYRRRNIKKLKHLDFRMLLPEDSNMEVLSTLEPVPDQRSHEVVAAGEEEEQPDKEEAAESLDLPPVTTKEEEEEGKPPPGNHGPFQVDLKDPGTTMLSGAPSVGNRPDGPGTSALQTHVVLRVRLLEDSETEVLSDTVFTTTPVQDLKCPCGLQESDFLDHLRSSFPQLANGEPFDIFKTNRNRKLLPLRVKALTPEEIYSTVESTGYSTLYIRLKAGKDKTRHNKEEFTGPHRTTDPPSSDPVTTDGTGLRSRLSFRKKVYRRRNIKKLKHLDFRMLLPEDSNMEVLSTLEPVPDQRSHEVVAAGEEEEQPDKEEAAESLDLPPVTTKEEEEEGKPPPGNHGPFQVDLKDPGTTMLSGAPSVGNRPDGPGTSALQKHVVLRVRLLEDSETEVLSDTVFTTTPVQDLKCPCGLQESDFLDHLRSSFPQLANGEPFDIFKTNRNRKLLPLRVKALTPEEIYSTVESTGYSTLYIRLKAGKDKTRHNNEEFTGPQRTTDPPSSDPVTTVGTGLRSRLSFRKKVYRRRNIKKLKHLDFRILLLEDSNMEVLSTLVYQKTPARYLKCPRGLQESEFLDLLRSSFPQLANGEQFDLFTANQRKRLLPLRVNFLTPEEIYSTITSIGYSYLYIRLKGGQKSEEKMEDGFPRVTSPLPVHPLLQKKTETRLHTSPLHIADSRGDGLSSSSASKPTDLQTEAGAENNMDPSNEEDDRNLDSEQQTHRISKRKSPERKVKKGEGAERDCKVCGVAFRHLAALIRHSWSHVEQQQDLCGVCEETFDSVEKLKEHLRTHLKVYRCAFCGINFVSILRLKKHTTRHTVKRVARCQVCKQTFTNMSDLHHHRQVHRKEKPHQCHICLRSFNLKDRLSVQRGDFTKEGKYTCDVCNKSSKPSACDPGPLDPLSRLGPHLQSLKETL